jgi:hypothetical protein
MNAMPSIKTFPHANLEMKEHEFSTRSARASVIQDFSIHAPAVRCISQR